MKRITLCALLMTLFLLSSCNTSGNATKDGQAAKSDGTVIDLDKITKNITDSVAFAKDVKEIHTLVKSIDELAKAIGKKLKKDTGEIETDASSNNGPLVVGVYSVISDINTKLTGLEQQVGISDELKSKITAAKDKSKAFLDKVKVEDDLCKKEVTDDHLKKAIDKTSDGSKGGKELIALNTAIDALLKAAEAAVTSAINELASPVKTETARS
ncbi:Vsp/OspC family lipoprotein [Borrelia venezuelensis]|uniref:Vsp/OspC family lipoprotein n=1 Tax=Borrelia venezuelensis TaxID=1653839 RepID=UPI0032E39F7B